MYDYRYYQPNTNGKFMSPRQDDRFIGGFVFPFLLGGVTGAALAPSFWNRPNYNYYPTYYPYPYYGPYYYR